MRRKALSVWWLALLGAGIFSVSACSDEQAPNQAPVFVDLAAEVQGRAGEAIAFTVTVEDPEGGGVSVRMEGAPQDARFIFSTFGRFVWTPGAQDADPAGRKHEVRFVALDSEGARQSHRMILNVFTSEGGARFTTTNSRVLDLSREPELVARVAVQDDDSLKVDMALEDAPEGMSIVQVGDKEAELRWLPSEDQISKKLIWGATVLADDGGAEAVPQAMTVTLLPKSCGDGVTRIQHASLDTQRGAEDFVIDAVITHPTNASLSPKVFWRLGGDPGDSGGFEGIEMVEGAQDEWRASIPNPLVPQGEVLDVYYFITAAESGGGGEGGCIARAPEQGRYSFAIFSPGEAGCRQDDAEPNDVIEEAPVLTELLDDRGLYEFYGLSLCEGDTDIFALDLQPNELVEAFVVPTDPGSNTLRLLSFDGVTVVEEDSDDLSVSVVAEQARRYFLELSGSETGYHLFVALIEGVDANCEADGFEPNDAADEASVLLPSNQAGLTICGDDKDYFAIEVPARATLSVTARFSHADGDLDMTLRGFEGRPIASALSTTDDETIIFRNDGEDEAVTLDVRPFQGGTQVYDLEVEVTLFDPNVCEEDGFEPNDLIDDVLHISHEGGLDMVTATMCGDPDLYPFDLLPGQRLEATIEFDPDVDLDLELITIDEDILEDSSGFEPIESLSYQAEFEETVFVRVISFDESVSDYTITVSLGDEDVACGEDANEPNNNFEIATAVSFDFLEEVEADLCGGDEDWFHFIVLPDEFLAITLSSRGDGPSLDFDEVEMDLRDGTGTNVIATAFERNDELEILLDTVFEEPLLLRVRNLSEVFFFDYHLEFAYLL